MSTLPRWPWLVSPPSPGGNAHERSVVVHADGYAIIRLAPAQSNPPLVFLPADKRVFRRMKNINAAAFAGEIFEIFFHRLRPRRAVIDVVAILDDDIVIRKSRMPRSPCHVIGFARRGADGDLEQTARREDAANERRCLLPVVVAVSIHDEHADFVVAGASEMSAAGKQNCHKAQPKATVHNADVPAQSIRPPDGG